MPVLRTCTHCGKTNRIPAHHLSDTGRCGNCKNPLPPIDEPVPVGPAEFDEIIRESRVPVLVDFWAAWCGPCRMIAPALDELSTELGDRVTIAKLNIDENPHVPTKYGVRGIPTMMIFSQGQVAATKVGALPKSKIKEWIEGSI